MNPTGLECAEALAALLAALLATFRIEEACEWLCRVLERWGESPESLGEILRTTRRWRKWPGRGE